MESISLFRWEETERQRRGSFCILTQLLWEVVWAPCREEHLESDRLGEHLLESPVTWDKILVSLMLSIFICKRRRQFLCGALIRVRNNKLYNK
jgi:hypothetical protein